MSKQRAASVGRALRKVRAGMRFPGVLSEGPHHSGVSIASPSRPLGRPEYISVFLVMAAMGSALTAGHFWKRAPKVTKRALAPPLGTSLRLGVPSLRLESVGRRHGPSLAQDGEPGVLPGYPRIQACVRPAWFYGAPKIKIKSRSRSRASLRIVGCFRSKADQEPRFALWGASGQKQIKSLASHCGALQIKSRSRASLRIVGCFRSKADQDQVPRFASWGGFLCG